MLHEFFLPRFDNLAVELRRKQRPILACKVVAYHHDINNITHLGHKADVVIQPEFKHLIEKHLAKTWILNHIHKPLLQPSHIPAYLIDHAAYAGRYGILCFLPHLQRLLSHTCETTSVTAIRKRVIIQLANSSISQGMMRDIHIKWFDPFDFLRAGTLASLSGVEGLLVIRHRPDYAEFIFKVVPVFAASGILLNPALKAVRPVSTYIKHINVKTLQNIFARLG